MSFENEIILLMLSFLLHPLLNLFCELPLLQLPLNEKKDIVVLIERTVMNDTGI